MTKNRVYTTDVSEIYWDERGFVRLNLLETQNSYGLEEMKMQLETASQIAGEGKYKVLVDTRGSNALADKEAQDFATNDAMRIAEAIIVNSLSMRILSKFYLKKNKNNAVKIFSKEKNAIDWLVNFSID
jgi:hypothetical protein